MNTRPNRIRAGFIAALIASLMVFAADRAHAAVFTDGTFHPIWIDGSEQYGELGGFGGRLVCMNGDGNDPLSAYVILPYDNGCPAILDVVVSEPPRLVPVTPIPEPETWALILAGLGLMARKRRTG